MKVSDFARLVCREERGSKEVNIAQVLEILKVANDLLAGQFYPVIRKEEAKW